MPKFLLKITFLLICTFLIVIPNSKAQTGCSWSPGGTNPKVWSPSGNPCTSCVSATDDNWENGANWNPSGVPTNSSRVYIPAGCSPQPRIYTGNPECFAIEIRSSSGAELTIQPGGTAILNVRGSW